MNKIDYAEFVRLLKNRKKSLSPRLQDVAHFVLNNPEDIAILTIVEIANAAKVPPSAVTRFTREVGFGKFSDLQAVFRERLVGPRLSYADRINLISRKRSPQGLGTPLDLHDPFVVLETFTASAHDSLLRGVDEQRDAPLAEFVETIRAAPAVHIVGNRGAFGVAAYSYYGLVSVGKRVFLLDNMGSMRAQQLHSVADNDVLLGISFDDYTSETVEIMGAASARKIRILAITDNELSPLAAVADTSLFVKEARLGHFRSQVPAMVLCQSIIASVGRSGDRNIGQR